jgi:single-strand DNA-binding protein
MGNLTRDPELKQTPSNQSVAQIGIAMNRKFKDREGNMREEVTFVDCEAWGRTAEVMSQYLSKGKPVFVEGRLKLDQWQDKDGGNRSKLKVVIENFQFIDSKGNQTSNPPAAATATQQPAPPADDIPF